MIKFKILRWALRLFLLICLIGIASNSYLTYMFRSENLKSQSELQHFYISSAMIVLLSTGLYLVHQSFTSFIKRSFFNRKSAVYLSSGGYILAATGLIGFVMDIIRWNALSESSLITNIAANTMLLLIGFGLTAVSDIIKKGENIKRENDLTI